MTFESYRMMVVAVFLILLGGCSWLPGGNLFELKSLQGSRTVPSMERNFATALQQLRAGNETAARELLQLVVDAPRLAGVTDEALFRLALLELRSESGGGEIRASNVLHQLFRQYPASIWSRQAAPLAEYLQETVALRARTRQIRSLKNQNLSLSRDNKDLRQSIERLKNLDIELEQKIRR